MVGKMMASTLSLTPGSSGSWGTKVQVGDGEVEKAAVLLEAMVMMVS